ncbi:DUF7503 family protein [Halorussus lipolyticus]|nr:hypothetical protein [Halorussus sp. DT80]
MAHTENVTEWLSEHPRMMGALWMVMLLLAESGSAVAGTGGMKMGP